jgi:Tfp pilus assembly major pilin PilA
MIVIAIIGILAAIALPAYSKYMARAKYSGVVDSVNGVKNEVAVCIMNTSPEFAANEVIGADECSNESSGSGYRIRQATDYESTYVASITVENGKITATAKDVEGLAGATYILEPYFTAVNTGAIDWKRSDDSTCIENDLC